MKAEADMMVVYCWYEKDKLEEAKFGERWVFTGQDPEQEVKKRVRNSVGVRKDLIRDGTVVLAKWWDVTVLAKKVGRYYQRSRMDDYLREYIGHRKGTTGEIHVFPGKIAHKEIVRFIDGYLANADQPLPSLDLTWLQATESEKVLNAIRGGKKVTVAEWCPRFGKTHAAGVIIKELSYPLTIVPSYVLQAHTSFNQDLADDLAGFEQYRDFVIIDTKDDDWQLDVKAALKAGKQVIVTISMYASKHRQSHLDWLFGLPGPRLIIIDEADFGVHCEKQARPLIDGRGPKDVVLMMTGTNADRAATHWQGMAPFTTSVTYPELLKEKRRARASYDTTLKHFKVNPRLHDRYVDVEFYKLPMTNLVRDAIKADPTLFQDELPSWSKWAKDVTKAKGFTTRMLGAFYGGMFSCPEISIDFQIKRRAKNGHQVDLWWLPGSITNEQLEIAEAQFQALMPNKIVFAIYGKDRGDGRARTTGDNVNDQVRDVIDNGLALGKDVVLLSARMAQRSFSECRINTVILAYDEGEAGATTQKMSRVLTPSKDIKIGWAISLAFDINTDDKFESIIAEAALNIRKRDGGTATQNILDVAATQDIFIGTTKGRMRLEPSQYLFRVMDRKTISRVFGKTFDLSKFDEGFLDEILRLGKADVKRLPKQDTAPRGKTYDVSIPKGQGQQSTSVSALEKKRAKVREILVTIFENLDYLVKGTPAKTLEEALDFIKRRPRYQELIMNKFGLKFETLRRLLTTSRNEIDWLDLEITRINVS